MDGDDTAEPLDLLAEFVLAFEVGETDGKRLPLDARQIEEVLRLEADE